MAYAAVIRLTDSTTPFTTRSRIGGSSIREAKSTALHKRTASVRSDSENSGCCTASVVARSRDASDACASPDCNNSIVSAATSTDTVDSTAPDDRGVMLELTLPCMLRSSMRRTRIWYAADEARSCRQPPP
eukprot:2460679-Rhodomonas_salina.1